MSKQLQNCDAPHKSNDLSTLGIEIMPEEKRPEMAVKLLENLKNSRKALATYMESCTHCGNCAEQCHVYLGTQDPKNMPVMRAELMRKVYKRYFTAGGKLLKGFEGAAEIDNETLEDWYKYFYQCNECRRCMRYCPFGIDTAEITIAGREVLAFLGMVPKFNMDTVNNLYKSGNNMGIMPFALEDSVEFLEDELLEETGLHIPIPVDKPDVDVLFNPSSSDFFTNTDGMMAVAKIFYSAGVSWTISSHIIETANFGLFFHEPTMMRHNRLLVNQGKELRVKKLVAGECGHGWRTWKNYTDTYNEDLPFPVRHIHEEIVDMLREGRIKVDKTKNPDPITYHDPCNYARAAGLIDQPREILNQCVMDFREMTPCRDNSFCCGGGSGILMDEIAETRMKMGKMKADCVRATGAKILCAPCAICKAQLPGVMQYHNVDVKIKGLTDLVGNALVL